MKFGKNWGFEILVEFEFSVNTANVIRHKASFDASCLTFEILAERPSL